jgi:hypothetical protein
LAVNLDKPHLWKDDIAASVDLYNEWFMAFAPQAFRDTRIHTTEAVERAFEWTNNLTGLTTNLITEHPDMLAMLRMCTCPPLARDRLIGLADLSPSLVWCMEVKKSIPPRMKPDALVAQLNKARDKILKLVDPDIFVWLGRKEAATVDEVHRAATIVADRLCGSQTDPIIRNAQERRQLRMIGEWLNERNYRHLPPGSSYTVASLPLGSYSFRLNAPVKQGEDGKLVNLPIDVVIKPHNGKPTDLPLLGTETGRTPWRVAEDQNLNHANICWTVSSAGSPFGTLKLRLGNEGISVNSDTRRSIHRRFGLSSIVLGAFFVSTSTGALADKNYPTSIVNDPGSAVTLTKCEVWARDWNKTIELAHASVPNALLDVGIAYSNASSKR